MDKLRRGQLIEPPRRRNPAIPTSIEAVVLKALAGEVTDRYQQADEVLRDLLQARRGLKARPVVAAGPARPSPSPVASRPASATARPRELAAGRFCWQCRKPLPSRSSRCPFCGETQ
jgi:serine/threonine-protein kinase